MIQRPVQFVHRQRAERVANLRTIESDPNNWKILAGLADPTMVGNVGELEASDEPPLFWAERVGFGRTLGVSHG